MFKKQSGIAAAMVAGSLFAAQAIAEALPGQDEAYWSDDDAGYQLTVFNPDGSFYSVTSETGWSVPEPVLLVMTQDDWPDQITVFEPDGTSRSYEFAQAEFVSLEPVYLVAVDEAEDLVAISEPYYILVEVAQPIQVSAADEDVSVDGLAALDMDEDFGAAQLAQIDLPSEASEPATS